MPTPRGAHGWTLWFGLRDQRGRLIKLPLPVERPRLKRTAEQISTPNGDLIYLRTGASDVEIQQPDAEERRLLAALDGTRSLDDLRTSFGSVYVDEAVDHLREAGLIEDATDDDRLEPSVRSRFDRQLRYFSDLGAVGGVTPAECQERLRQAHVVVLGTGGLGGRVAFDLACCGVGELSLLDGDRVEESNLNRQIQYAEADIGSRKVDVMAARLQAFYSEMRINAIAQRMESQDDIAAYVTGADMVVDAADWPPHELEHWCNNACFEAGVPYIAMSHFPAVVRVGPLYVPGETGCFACQDRQYRSQYPLYDTVIEQLRGRPSPAGTLGPACGLAGGMVAAEVMHYLTGLVPPPMLGAGFVLDLRTLEVEKYDVEPQPECPVCGHLRMGRTNSSDYSAGGSDR